MNGVFLPWDSGWQALGVYGLVSLVTDRQEYRIDKYSTAGDLSGVRDGLVSRKETALDARFGFGVGMRVYLVRHLSLWLEKRWIVGESFSRPVAPDAGGATGEAGALTGDDTGDAVCPDLLFWSGSLLLMGGMSIAPWHLTRAGSLVRYRPESVGLAVQPYSRLPPLKVRLTYGRVKGLAVGWSSVECA